MPVTMHQASVPVFVQGLGGLSAILDKAVAHAEARKIDPAALLQARLFPDMFPLTRQVQLSTDFAKGAVARLAGIDIPKYEDVETTFDELKARLARTIDFAKGIEPAKMEGSEEREVKIQLRDRTLTFPGRTYLIHSALPQFWFHVTAAYAILRHNGVELGKRDFVGKF